MGYRHIDTGAMYRAVGWKALHDGLSLDDEAALAALAERASLVVEGGVVAVDGHDVTRAIRTPEMDKTAAAVARLPRVRAALVARQRAIGAQGGVVMEGRDIGTVVFPGGQPEGLSGCFGRRARPPPGQRQRPLGRRRRAGGRRRGARSPGPLGHDAHGVAAHGRARTPW